MVASTPCLGDQINRNLYNYNQGMKNKLNVIRDEEMEQSFGIETRARNNWAITYVDDLTNGEIQDLRGAVTLITTEKEEKRAHAKVCEEKFEIISRNSDNIGMKINGAKTQLLSISDNNFANVVSYINVPGEASIYSESRMKILGFIFGERPSVKYHVENTVNKFKKKIWMINHLKRAKIDKNVLLDVLFVHVTPDFRILQSSIPPYAKC